MRRKPLPVPLLVRSAPALHDVGPLLNIRPLPNSGRFVSQKDSG